MIQANTITKQAYDEGWRKRLVASELGEAGRYYANIIEPQPELGAFATSDYVRMDAIKRHDDRFRIEMISVESGKLAVYTMDLVGVVFVPGRDPVEGEFGHGYLSNLPLDEENNALDAWIAELDPIRADHWETKPAEMTQSVQLPRTSYPNY